MTALLTGGPIETIEAKYRIYRTYVNGRPTTRTEKVVPIISLTPDISEAVEATSRDVTFRFNISLEKIFDGVSASRPSRQRRQTSHISDITLTAKFEVELEAQQRTGIHTVHSPPITLTIGAGNPPPEFGQIDVSHTMIDPDEHWRVSARVIFTVDDPTLEGPNARSGRTKTTIHDVLYKTYHLKLDLFGNLTLNYIPLSIVYCPPGQDMTNSVELSENFGSQYTIGNTRQFSFSTETNVGGNVSASFRGFTQGANAKAGRQRSQATNNSATHTMRLNFLRKMQITADNQKAIGRAYWGPLNDLFLLMLNPKFLMWGKPDNFLYNFIDAEKLLVLPAHELLRPNTDTWAYIMPPQERRQLLELDPFIHNLDEFFPNDTGQDLQIAANPYADPGERGVLLGDWFLGKGTELNYSIEEEVKLETHAGTQLNYSTQYTVSGGLSSNILGILGTSSGGSSSNSMNVGIQESVGNFESKSKTASCFLIRNQNDPENYAIKIHYDKNFGSFMFQKINQSFVLEPADIPPVWVVLEIINSVTKETPSSKLGKKNTKANLDLESVDFGLSKMYPDASSATITKLKNKMMPFLSRNKSITGIVKTITDGPLYYDDVFLIKEKKDYFKNCH